MECPLCLSCIWTRSEDIIQGFYDNLVQMNDPILKLVLIKCGGVAVNDDKFGYLGVSEIMPSDQTFHTFVKELHIQK